MSSAEPSPRSPTIGPSSIKALAHPLRLRLYEELYDRGPATASMLGRWVGESSGQTSYHLRQLAAHGLVAEVAGKGTARERWWQAEGYSFGVEDIGTDTSTRMAVDAIQHHLLQSRTRRVLEWLSRQPEEQPQWLGAAISGETTARMTPSEVQAMTAELERVRADHLRKCKESREEEEAAGLVRPEVRTVRTIYYAFPLPARDVEQDPETDEPGASVSDRLSSAADNR